MYKNYFVCFFGFLVLCPSFVRAQPFRCDNQFFTSYFNASGYEISDWRGLPPGREFSLVNIINGFPVTINAIGFRKGENMIYGVDPDFFDLFRVDSSGLIEVLTNLNLKPGNNYLAGDIARNGDQMILIGSSVSDNSTDLEMVQIDLTSANYTTNFFSMNQTTLLGDIAFDPLDGKLYGFDNKLRRLVIINPTSGAITTTFFTNNDISFIEAIYFNSFGELFGFGLSTVVGGQYVLFKFNKDTGVSTIQGAVSPLREGRQHNTGHGEIQKNISATPIFSELRMSRCTICVVLFLQDVAYHVIL